MGDYNTFAKEYKKLTEELDKQIRKHIYSLLPNSLESKTILDVGCGSGQDAEYYNNQGAEVYGIDISENQIELIRRTTKGTFIVGNMNQLPYESNIFDIVTSIYALQTSDNVPQALEEMIRVAKPGTPILILTKHPFRNFLEGWINDCNKDYFNQGNVTSHIFNRIIKLTEPGHTMKEYLHPNVLETATLEYYDERQDFPASDQVIPGLVYPTYMIIRYRKK